MPVSARLINSQSLILTETHLSLLTYLLALRLHVITVLQVCWGELMTALEWKDTGIISSERWTLMEPLFHFFYHGQTVTCWSNPTSGDFKLLWEGNIHVCMYSELKKWTFSLCSPWFFLCNSINLLSQFPPVGTLGHYNKMVTYPISCRLYVWTHYHPGLFQQNLCHCRNPS